MALLFSQFLNGLQTGSIYALVALGYSMVYGIILLLNFATSSWSALTPRITP